MPGRRSSSRASLQASSASAACSADQWRTTPRAVRATVASGAEWSFVTPRRTLCVDENVQLLADEQRDVVSFDAINDLKDPRVDTFRAVAGQRSFGHDE